MTYKRNAKPVISVIVPVFNASRYLQAALESILNQTYKNFELIVIDDGSTDNSYQIAKSLARTDSRLHVFKNKKNLNIIATLNRGVKLTRGQYIARMDADDIALPERLKIQLRYLRTHPETIVVGSNCYTIDQENNFIGFKRFPLSNKAIKSMIFLINPMQHPTMLINTSLLPKNFSWYNTNLVHAEDLDLLFRLAKIGRVKNLRKPLLFYRLHLNSKTFKDPRKNYEETKVIRKLAIEKYGYTKPNYLRVINRIQEAMILLLPASVIYVIYNLIRDFSYLLSQRQNQKKAKIQRDIDALIPHVAVPC